jgi:4-hydroxy-2-oxoheptanedioate aldolase
VLVRKNTAKALLQQGKPAVGAWMNFPSVVAAEALASIGWDWICVDTEHGAIDLETAQNLFLAIGANGTIPIARVPWNDVISIHRILDAGAYGIVVPMVNSAEEAERAVKAAKYPPDGMRSAGGGRWRYWAGADYPRHANDEIMVVVMIEHIDAVSRAEEILSVPGVDACFIGPNDLAWSMGCALDKGPKDPSHIEAVAKVLEAAKKVGVPAGIHCLSPDDVNGRIEAGFQFLACMSDGAFLMKSATEAFQKIRRPG